MQQASLEKEREKAPELAFKKILTPREVVSELDKYIIGQKEAKRSVAIALRNRWRRKQVPEELKDEIAPKNIIMMGPTGVGKTEIARRLARLSQAPFLKVEASKYTEVGYVGRDVESMIRDLTELAVKMIKEEEMESLKPKARELAQERILDILLPKRPSPPRTAIEKKEEGEKLLVSLPSEDQTREKIRTMLKQGKLENRYVDLETSERSFPVIEIFSTTGMEEMDVNFRDIFGNLFPKRTKKRRVKINEALEILSHEEAQKLLDMDQLTRKAIERVENAGIIFIDELDKIAGRETGHGPDVSRQGVQRDLLPIIEGSTVTTKYGMVRTDHILFIAAGAFHISKPSDLIPELQGRFPIRVELSSLNKDDFVRILTEPANALIKQYVALMETEGVSLKFTEGAISKLAEIAEEVNTHTENIGARRLHTVMEKLLDEISFSAPEMNELEITVDENYVEEKLRDIVKDHDLSRYIL